MYLAGRPDRRSSLGTTATVANRPRAFNSPAGGRRSGRFARLRTLFRYFLLLERYGQ